MQPLMEAGLDSLGAIELQNIIASHFHVDLPSTFAFDYPSVASMATYLAKALSNIKQASIEDMQSKLALSLDSSQRGYNLTCMMGASCYCPGGGAQTSVSIQI